MASPARKTSSTSPSSRRRVWPWALLIIVSLELGERFLPDQAPFRQAVEKVTNNLETKRFDSSYILLGDSIVKRSISRRMPEGRDYANLAAIFPIEVSGQYFLVKRCLDRHPAPKAFVYVAVLPFRRNLNSKDAQWHTSRAFNRFDEIIDLLKVKRDFSLALTTLVTRFLPTLRNRAVLQNDYLGFAFSEGIEAQVKIAPAANYLPLGQNISEIYFERLLALLKDRNIELYYIRSARPDGDGSGIEISLVNVEPYLAGLAKRFPNFHYDLNTPFVYPAELFGDHIHFAKADGEELFYKDLSSYLERKLGKALPPPLDLPVNP